MRTRRLPLVATAVLVLLGTWSVPVAGGPPSGNAVTAWNDTAVTVLTGLPGPAGGAPPAAQVHVAMVQGAVYDAVNATEPRHYRPYLLTRRTSARASQDAAVAAAAHGVLRHLVATVPHLPSADRAKLLSSLAAQYQAALSRVPDGPFERQGVTIGDASAAAMIADRQDDGRFGPSPWVPDASPGHWWPQTNPVTRQPLLDPTPWVGNVKPFVLASASQVRTAGPLALSSAAYAAELEEVMRLGAVDSSARTATQTYIARWWQSTPVSSWNEVGRALAVRGGLDALETARLLAMQNLGAADAAIGCWNDKYFWDFWRPADAIHRAAEDGNPATVPDGRWSPLISAPYAEHPSGHLCLDGAHTRVLQHYFGDVAAGGFQITSSAPLIGPAGAQRTFGSFSQALDEVRDARIWAGLHFRTADEQAELLGQRVVDHLMATAFQRVGRAP